MARNSLRRSELASAKAVPDSYLAGATNDGFMPCAVQRRPSDPDRCGYRPAFSYMIGPPAAHAPQDKLDIPRRTLKREANMNIARVRILHGLAAFAGAVLGNAVVAAEAGGGDGAKASCVPFVKLTCPERTDQSDTFVACHFSVNLISQNPDKQVYGCEIKIKKYIKDKITIDVLVDKKAKARWRSVNLNYYQNQTHLAIYVDYFGGQPKPAHISATVTFTGAIEKVERK